VSTDYTPSPSEIEAAADSLVEEILARRGRWQGIEVQEVEEVAESRYDLLRRWLGPLGRRVAISIRPIVVVLIAVIAAAVGQFAVELGAGRVPIPEAWRWAVPIVNAGLVALVANLPTTFSRRKGRGG